MNKNRTVVTCVYCGHEYPDGTPKAKHDLLTSHISICVKHPMRKAELTIISLQKALSDLIMAKTKEELDKALDANLKLCFEHLDNVSDKDSSKDNGDTARILSLIKEVNKH